MRRHKEQESESERATKRESERTRKQESEKARERESERGERGVKERERERERKKPHRLSFCGHNTIRARWWTCEKERKKENPSSVICGHPCRLGSEDTQSKKARSRERESERARERARGRESERE